MELSEIRNKEIWEKLCEKCPHDKTFLQSFNWGVFNEKMGNKVFYFAIQERSNVIALCLTILVKAKRGNFLLVPHGPLILSDGKKEEIMKFLVGELSALGKKEGAGFIRLCPILENNFENEKMLRNIGFIPAPIHMHPEITWVLDISKPESELLYGMRKTTRYLIRQAFNIKDLKVVASKDLKDLDKFYDIYLYTAKSQGFIPFSLEYLKNEFEVFSQDKKAMIFFAEYKKKVLSSAFIVFWKDTIFYHHGASLRDKVPASYLLQWEIIKTAKLSNYKYYNFWGISPIKRKSRQIIFSNPRHPWNGLSRFKMGFGGEPKEYVKTMDFPLSKTKYLINKFIELARKKKRGL